MAVNWGNIIEGFVDGVYNSPTEENQKNIIDNQENQLNKMFQINEQLQKYIIFCGLGFVGIMLFQNMMSRG